MILKRYQNEWIVLTAVVLMLFAFAYKQNQLASQKALMSDVTKTSEELKEVMALQKIWADKKTAQYVNKLQALAQPSKLKWSSKSKNVTALYKGLTPRELDKVVSKILTLPVEIKKLMVENKGTLYDVEFQCKW
jgi:hypothetical protein